VPEVASLDSTFFESSLHNDSKLFIFQIVLEINQRAKSRKKLTLLKFSEH